MAGAIVTLYVNGTKEYGQQGDEESTGNNTQPEISHSETSKNKNKKNAAYLG